MFDSIENVVLKFESKGSDATRKSMNAYLSRGTYYVLVTSVGIYSHNDADYKLTVNYTENKDEFEIEQNSDRENATVISEVNKPITGNIRVESDIDFYKITLQNPGKVNLVFNHSKANSV